MGNFLGSISLFLHSPHPIPLQNLPTSILPPLVQPSFKRKLLSFTNFHPLHYVHMGQEKATEVQGYQHIVKIHQTTSIFNNLQKTSQNDIVSKYSSDQIEFESIRTKYRNTKKTRRRKRYRGHRNDVIANRCSLMQTQGR